MERPCLRLGTGPLGVSAASGSSLDTSSLELCSGARRVCIHSRLLAIVAFPSEQLDGQIGARVK